MVLLLPPELLWKYRPWDEYTRALVERGEVYFALPRQLNDPFEFRWRVRFPSNREEREIIAASICSETYPGAKGTEWERRFRELCDQIDYYARNHDRQMMPFYQRDDWGVFSASERNDNILLWSHYANNHTGVSVGVNPLLMLPRKFLQIRYSEEFPIANLREFVSYSFATFEKIALTKAIHWNYEREWRTSSTSGVQTFQECVQAIVIGHSASDQTVDEVFQAVETAGREIAVYRASISGTRFAVDVAPLHARR